MRTRTSVLCLALAIAAPAEALAQQPADAHAQADDRFHKAREAQDAGNYKLALQLFQESQSLEPGRGKLLNIALCEEKLGLVATASRDFQDLLPKLADDPERAGIVKDHLASVEPRVPHLKITLDPKAPPGTIVALDGVSISPAALAAEMPLDPGKHAIAVHAPGHADRSYEVVAEEGKLAAITAEPGELPRAIVEPPPPVEPPSNAGQGKRIGGFVIGGIGVVGLGVGAITGVMAVVDHGAAESACPSHKGCSQAVLDKASAGKTLSTVSTVALAVGAVGAGVGLALVLTSKPRPTTPQVGLTLLPDGGRIGIRGAF